jgi:hypothetical protein
MTLKNKENITLRAMSFMLSAMEIVPEGELFRLETDILRT